MKTKSGGKAPAKKAQKRGKAQPEAPVTVSNPSPEAGVEKTSRKRIRNYKRHAKEVIAKEFPEIMKGMAEKSKAGSLSHIKYLFELGGVREDIEHQVHGKGEPSLAELLLAEARKQRAAAGISAGEAEKNKAEDVTGSEPGWETGHAARVAAGRDEPSKDERSGNERGGDCGARKR